MLTQFFVFLLAIYYYYSDTQCTNNNYYKYSIFPLNTCYRFGSDYYKLSCSNGAVQELKYSDSTCSTSVSTNTYSTSCTGSTKYTCNAAPSPPTPTPPSPTPPTPSSLSYVIYKYYAITGCAGNVTKTIAYVQGACYAYGSTTPTSDISFCTNNVGYYNYYSGSKTCTGTPTLNSYPTTCTR